MRFLVAIQSALQRAAAAATRWARKLWPWRKPPRFTGERVEDFPDRLRPARVYLAGEGTNLWGAALLCPCGCGETIQLNLLKQVRPCWTVSEHADGSVSLAPSVWRSHGCNSHFFVRHGRIEWC